MSLFPTPSLACRDDHVRREQTRRAPLTGFDEVEVDEAQTTLRVTFLGRAPDDLTAAHLRLEGGRRLPAPRIVEAQVQRAEDDDLDDVLVVRVERPGDLSPHTLRLLALDEAGRPTGGVPPGVDPRYAAVCFSFKASCPSELDCVAEDDCPAPALDEPAIDLLAKDYASFRRLMLDRLALLLPDWQERHVPDLGIALVEVLAYAADQLSYQQDAVATEAYLDTARLRVSVRRHARLVDYLLHEGCNARTWLTAEVDDEAVTLRPEDFYAITRHPERPDALLAEADLQALAPLPYLVFEPLPLPLAPSPVCWRRARNRIRLHTWGGAECCLARGATSATLRDPGKAPDAVPPDPRGGDHCVPTPTAADLEAEVATGRWHELQLTVGEVLVFEEVIGPRTGDPADADPRHRHAVRLTGATPGWDRLTHELVWTVTWCIEDALPFTLCLQTTSDAPHCKPLQDVSIAWGNVLLVDHGLSVDEDLQPVPQLDDTARCEDPCHGAEVTRRAGRHRPPLSRPELTHGVPLPACHPEDVCGGCGPHAASQLLLQDPRAALPAITLDADGARWYARADLLASGGEDAHFVVETDDDRVAWLRFGDGQSGRAPEAGQVLRASYRTGNGPVGNLGADSLVQLVFRRALPNGAGIRVRNPLPAVGGTAAEPTAEARLRAPRAFRRRLERAIAPTDYAAIVERDFAHRVQRAAAVFRASGAAVEVQVAIDALGRDEPDAALLACIEAHLQRYRRIGHDVRVVPARAVPLDVALHVCVAGGYLRGQVKAALAQALGRGTAARPGFSHPDALKVGEPVHASRLIAAAQAVPGVAGVVLLRLRRLYEGDNGELAAGVLAIGPLEVARLDNDPSAPDLGVLTLQLEGGR